MPKPLPGAGALISDAWRLFISTWNDSVKISIWFLYIGLGQFALNLLGSFSLGFQFVAVLLGWVLVGATIWTTIRLIRGMLLLDAGKKIDLSPEEMKRSWYLFVPLLFIALLTSLATIGGLLVFILPGIYLAIVLTFSQLCLIDQNLHGVAALAASRDLVKDRWWQTFWRLLAGWFVFGVGLLIVTAASFTLIALLAGPGRFLALAKADQTDALLSGALSLFQAIIHAATIPLFIGFQVKVYRALQRSK